MFWLVIFTMGVSISEGGEGVSPSGGQHHLIKKELEPAGTTDVDSKPDQAKNRKQPKKEDGNSPTDRPGKVAESKDADSENQDVVGKDKATVKKGFDIDELTRRLKETRAIGFFTKLAIRSDAMDLLHQAEKYRTSEGRAKLETLRERFNGLLLKILALLQDDPKLAEDISLAREDIWKSVLEVTT